jgi:hypothetical protein
MVEVQWYYKKCHLDFENLQIPETDRLFIGENEIFPSCHQDKVFVDSIFSKCRVCSMKQYDELDLIDTKTFFTRAMYNPLLKVMDPPFKDWDRLCVCKKPLNPNLVHIKCDECCKWFHPECMGIEIDEDHTLD